MPWPAPVTTATFPIKHFAHWCEASLLAVALVPMGLMAAWGDSRRKSMPHIIYKADATKYSFGCWCARRGDLIGRTRTSVCSARQRPAVLGHHAVNLFFTEPVPSEVQGKDLAGLRQTFGVRPVRTKKDVIRADEILQLAQVGPRRTGRSRRAGGAFRPGLIGMIPASGCVS